MRAPFRFGDNFIDHIEFQQILRRQFKRLGRFGGVTPIPPQNGGAGFRADDRVVSVLKDQYTVCNANAKRAARSALADDRGDNRHAQSHHFAKIYRDCFRNVTFLRADPRKCAWSVDQ